MQRFDGYAQALQRQGRSLSFHAGGDRRGAGTFQGRSADAGVYSRSFVDGFFLTQQSEVGRLSDAEGEFYAPKLAAAVRAWNEVTSAEALNGKTPKKALEVWLRKHANEYGLTSKDGNPNELGIEEICKVANWKPSGGASPTPTPLGKATQGSASEGRKVRPRPPTPPKAKPLPVASSDILEDDIPF